MTRPLISDATMFAAQRTANRNRRIPIKPMREPARLPALDEFDPRETPTPWWWKAVLVGVMAAAFWAGVVL